MSDKSDFVKIGDDELLEKLKELQELIDCQENMPKNVSECLKV
jgi:hypothetical protein